MLSVSHIDSVLEVSLLTFYMLNDYHTYEPARCHS